jgi:hypothetical protein
MANHCSTSNSPAFGVRLRPARLRPIDVLMLGLCSIGLSGAWLFHGMTAANGTLFDGASVPGAAESSVNGAWVLADPLDGSKSAEAIPIEGLAAEPADIEGISGTEAALGNTDTPGAPEAADEGQAHTSGGAAAGSPAPALPPASAPLRITYPAAGMDVAVHPLQPAAGTLNIEPPATMDGYWLTPFGQPGVGSDNTTYVIGHSWLDRDAPFNHLSSAAAPGGQFTVTTASGAMTYRVDSVRTYSKPALKDSAIWDVVPNRLVLISCYSADPWGSNVTVVASPILAP